MSEPSGYFAAPDDDAPLPCPPSVPAPTEYAQPPGKG